MRNFYKRGEIATILTLGTVIVLGIATLVSSTFLKNTTLKTNSNAQSLPMASTVACATFAQDESKYSDARPPSNYTWEVNCNAGCGSNGTETCVVPGGSGYTGQKWCYGFADGAHCMYLKSVNNSGSNPQPTATPAPATTNAPGACRDNPVAPPAGYTWKAACGGTACSSNAQCPSGANGQSGWCFGFDGGAPGAYGQQYWRCLQLQTASNGPTPTTAPLQCFDADQQKMHAIGESYCLNSTFQRTCIANSTTGTALQGKSCPGGCGLVDGVITCKQTTSTGGGGSTGGSGGSTGGAGGTTGGSGSGTGTGGGATATPAVNACTKIKDKFGNPVPTNGTVYCGVDGNLDQCNNGKVTPSKYCDFGCEPQSGTNAGKFFQCKANPDYCSDDAGPFCSNGYYCNSSHTCVAAVSLTPTPTDTPTPVITGGGGTGQTCNTQVCNENKTEGACNACGTKCFWSPPGTSYGQCFDRSGTGPVATPTPAPPNSNTTIKLYIYNTNSDKTIDVTGVTIANDYAEPVYTQTSEFKLKQNNARIIPFTQKTLNCNNFKVTLKIKDDASVPWNSGSDFTISNVRCDFANIGITYKSYEDPKLTILNTGKHLVNVVNNTGSDLEIKKMQVNGSDFSVPTYVKLATNASYILDETVFGGDIRPACTGQQSYKINIIGREDSLFGQDFNQTSESLPCNSSDEQLVDLYKNNGNITVRGTNVSSAVTSTVQTSVFKSDCSVLLQDGQPVPDGAICPTQ